MDVSWVEYWLYTGYTLVEYWLSGYFNTGSRHFNKIVVEVNFSTFIVLLQYVFLNKYFKK